jgi:hypothetical protein
MFHKSYICPDIYYIYGIPDNNGGTSSGFIIAGNNPDNKLGGGTQVEIIDRQ